MTRIAGLAQAGVVAARGWRGRGACWRARSACGGALARGSWHVEGAAWKVLRASVKRSDEELFSAELFDEELV